MGLFDRFKKREREAETPSFKISMTAHEPTPEEMQTQFDEDTQLHIRNFQKDEAGLYPHEILMLSYLEKYAAGAEPARFWKQKYGVEDIGALIKSLEDRGFAEDGKLTEKGKDEVKCNEYVLYMHRNPISDISLAEMSILVNQNPGRPYRDILWGEFNRLSLKYTKNLNYGYYRNIRYTMYSFLLEEKRYKDALCSLSEVVFMDLNSDFPEVLPRMRKNIIEIEHKLDMTDEEMIDMLLKSLSDGMLRKHKYYTAKEAVCIIVAYAYGHDDIAEKILHQKEHIWKE
ncbi:MAG: hypothetical protein LUI13_09825 [Lachnospiraceae bacterium]|nr:hypothetical protein [Lachnospiraceae bacterium]